MKNLITDYNELVKAFSPRIAECGACGIECEVDGWMRKTEFHQYQPRPYQETDLFYCGCQHEDY